MADSSCVPSAYPFDDVATPRLISRFPVANLRSFKAGFDLQTGIMPHCTSAVLALGQQKEGQLHMGF
jgi:hypothetical protein